MYPWLESHLRAAVRRIHRNERGQDVITWLLVIFVLWLIIAGRRVIVQ